MGIVLPGRKTFHARQPVRRMRSAGILPALCPLGRARRPPSIFTKAPMSRPSEQKEFKGRGKA